MSAGEANGQRSDPGDVGRWVELEHERNRLVTAYRELEGHYLAAESERKRLEQYIRAMEGVS
jgi:hypothetical protein